MKQHLRAMKNYQLTETERTNLLLLMKQDHSKVQRAIFEIANRIVGHAPTTETDGIFKFEGGVTCRRREIAIKRGYVKDGWVRTREKTPEEAAVVQAIREVAALPTVAGYVNHTSGDPLRDLYQQLLQP